MSTALLRRLTGLAMGACITVGIIAATGTNSVAQITVKCWKEYCTKDPETGKEYCVKETIDCPPEAN